MTLREIQALLLELHGFGVSHDRISATPDELMDEVVRWQQRLVETMYPIIHFDALLLKIRDEGSVKNKAVYRRWVTRLESRMPSLWVRLDPPWVEA